jgi:hypothetical protein
MEQRSTSAEKEERILLHRSCLEFAAISGDILARLAVSTENNMETGPKSGLSSLYSAAQKESQNKHGQFAGTGFTPTLTQAAIYLSQR